MKFNINSISRRDFIKLGGGLTLLLLSPLSSGTINKAMAMEYFSNMPDIPKNPDKEIYYTAHIENFGWTDWCYDGLLCGSPEKNRAIGAIAIILKKGIASYEAFLQSVSWTDWYGGGDVCGFIDGGQPFVAIKIRVPNKTVAYRTHFYNEGWTEWSKNGKICGSPKSLKTLNAIEMKIIQ